MNTKENQNEEENVDVVTPSVIDQPNNNTDTSNTSSSGLQQIEDDNNGLPLPMGAAEVMISNTVEPPKQNMRKVVQFDDDDLGPEPPAATLEASLNATEHEDVIAKKIAKDDMNQKPAAVSNTNTNEEVMLPSLDRDSIYVPSMEIIEGGAPDNTNTGRGDTNRRGWEDIESQIRTINNEDTAGSINEESADDVSVDTPSSMNKEGLPEVEAYLVEDIDEEVYIATPTLPWWKQRRTKILLGVILLLLILMVIAIAIAFTQPNNPAENTVFLNSTDAPSVSLAPSSSPTECVNKIISNKQGIDLIEHLPIDDVIRQKLAVDGRNMVIVALDKKYTSTSYDGPVYITFYLLDNDNEWQRLQSPILVDVSDNNGLPTPSVAMSGMTAFVGFPYADDEASFVLVYEQNQFGEWMRVDDPFIQTANATKPYFGSDIDVDGDLACVKDKNDFNLFHRGDAGNNKWVQFDTIKDSWACSISGDTIAIKFGNSIQLYKYNHDQNEMAPTQEPISTTESVSSMDLINDYLVYLDWYESTVYIYNRNEMNQTFTFHQKLHIYGRLRYNSLTLDNDILVVAGDDHTYIYSLQDGDWVLSIAIDESFDDYQLSGRNLVTTKYNYNFTSSSSSEIYAFNIQDCTQDMPTQLPSLSPSSPPSVSSIPTTTFKCFDADDGGRFKGTQEVEDGILYTAVRSYVDQDCVNDKECDIGQVYGWPMNSWCVGSVKDMSSLFNDMDTFNEDISGWDTSSVTAMSYM